MLNELFQRPKRRHVKELNLVPVIDMFTTVVFFLLLSSSFDTYSKITLPPSATVSVFESTDKEEPLTPKLVLLKNSDTEMELQLSWQGKTPGSLTEKIPMQKATPRESLVTSAAKIVKDFAKKFPSETALQLGLEGELKYQDLISVMDGARETIASIVLISYENLAPKGP